MRKILNLVLFGLLLLPAAAQPKHKNFTVSVYVRCSFLPPRSPSTRISPFPSMSVRMKWKR